jgi:DNA-directed RNA polymerase alpha subunit
MTTNDLARQKLAQQRQDQDHLDESMLTRAEAELQNADNELEEDTREHLAQQRQREDQRQESLRQRSEDEVGLP